MIVIPIAIFCTPLYTIKYSMVIPSRPQRCQQSQSAQACSQCLQVVFDVMQCDEGIIFYHDVKEGQGTGGRVSLISLFPPVGFGGGGYGCCSRDLWERSKTHCPKFTKGASPERVHFPPKKLLQISFERALEYRNIL